MNIGNYHKHSGLTPSDLRAHVAKLATEGRGREALAKGARLLGIDLSKPVDFRLFSVGGLRVGSEPPIAKCKV